MAPMSGELASRDTEINFLQIITGSACILIYISLDFARIIGLSRYPNIPHPIHPVATIYEIYFASLGDSPNPPWLNLIVEL